MGLVAVDLLEDVGTEQLVLDAASPAVLLRSLLSALIKELTEPVNVKIQILKGYIKLKNIVTCSWGQTWVGHPVLQVMVLLLPAWWP